MICLYCGKEFIQRNKRQKCCCKKCGRNLLEIQYKAERDAKKPEPVLIKCPICGKEFYPRDIQQKTCSPTCRNYARYLREKAAGKRQGLRIKGYTYTCKQCGKVYHPKSTERDKFCSRECA